MSERALVAVSAENGWLYGRTDWHDDRDRPTDGWRSLAERPPEARSFVAVLEWLDFARFDGIYRATGDGWTPLLACWFGIETRLGERTREPRGDGAAVAIRSARDAAALRTWLRGAKRSVADAVRAGELSRTDAREQLLEGLHRRAGEREVVVGTPTSETRDSRPFCDRPGYRRP